MTTSPLHFVRAHTVLTAPSLVPEIRLHLATEILPLWSKTEEQIEKEGLPPPYWAFAWAGGQALARYVLDKPETVRGRRVLDFGSGSGLVAIAAAKAGASSVLAADVDAFAAAAIVINARANDVEIDVRQKDVLEHRCVWETVLVGDMCYERPLAERLLAWLGKAMQGGTQVFLGDPGRNYFPKAGVEKLASYQVTSSRDLEDRDIRATAVYRLAARAAAGPT
jgi:predicted nicotinamide N-methyase